MRITEQRYLITVIALSLFLLFLLTAGVLVLSDAARLRDQLGRETEEMADRAVEEFSSLEKTLQESETPMDAADWEYYGLLWSLSEQERFSESVTTARDVRIFRADSEQGLLDGSWTMLRCFGEQNMLLIEGRDKAGTIQRIPAVFLANASVDVQYLMSLPWPETFAYTLTGCWHDGQFVVQSISARQGEFPLPEYAFQEEVDLPGNFETISLVRATVRPLRMVTGIRSSGRYQRAVNKSVKLLSNLHMELPQSTREKEVYTLSRSRSRVTIAGTVTVPVRQETGTEKVVFLWGGSFSPVGLAWRHFWLGGSGAALGVFFLLAGLLIYGGAASFRQREIRRLQDEITRQEQALGYARDAEQSRREMTSAIAHELKTPISVLATYAEALRENIDSSKQEKYLGVLQEETARMDRMVLELLDLSRLEAGKYRLQREDFDLEELVRQVAEPFRPELEQRGITLRYQTDKTRVNADSQRMAQVAENFLTNAIRYCSEGGTIQIRIGVGGETFSVENTGAHIAQEHLEKVWETFWQGDASRNQRGSGLGLAICKTIVHLHGGTCRAENTPSGVRFSVNLEPLKRQTQPVRMPKEEEVHLQYPMGQLRRTTLEQVFRGLGLLDRQALKQQIRLGRILVDGRTAERVRQPLPEGSVIQWQEITIKVVEDGTTASQAFLIDRMRSGSFGNIDIAKNGSISVGH